MNNRHRVIGWAVVSVGTVNSSLVHPREVFGPAIRMGSSAILLAHNHPSGDPEPSIEDKQVTKRLLEAGELLGVPVLDHIIIGSEGSYVSLRERMSGW
jgi:DNA repair protein RadC